MTGRRLTFLRIEVWPISLAVSKSPLRDASSTATSAGGVVGVVAAVAGIGGVVVSPATISVVAVVRLAAIGVAAAMLDWPPS